MIKKMWKENQKGFSLVEMIIVIAIAAILAGAAIGMTSQLRYANTKKVVDTIDDAITRLQVTAMSQEDMPYLYIYECDGNVYMKTTTTELTSYNGTVLDKSGTKLTNSNIKVYSQTADEASTESTDGSVSGTQVSGTDFIKVAYTRSSTFSDKTSTEYITVVGSHTSQIHLVTDTGKHFVD
ncbi:MAG: prepilin-type N-terminal cleavage/methylation domain-containing protein [Clostridiales bacterium]|nr:prepilin-type N-terminal cleavage/methylation domain-containing protein [Clostridiales bacterium]